jgi:hypothetical protein
MRKLTGRVGRKLRAMSSGQFFRPGHASAAGLEQPRLVSSEAACNVVEFRGKYYVLPKALGPVEVDKQRVEKIPGVHVTDTREDAMNYARKYRSQHGGGRR